MNRIAVFGGTFNPVHIGHIHNAQYAADAFQLDRVLFVPSRQPVHKEVEYDPGASHRFRMLQIALDAYPRMEVSAIELSRTEPSYTVLTVNTVLAAYMPDELYFILGTDSFNTLRSWKEYRQLIHRVSFIVLRRPGDSLDWTLCDELPRCYTAENDTVDISSTALRTMLKEKKDCTPYMDRAVLDYIETEELYHT